MILLVIILLYFTKSYWKMFDQVVEDNVIGIVTNEFNNI